MERRTIPLFKVRMSPLAGERVAAVLQSGYIGQGQEVDLFERELGDYLSHPAPLTLNSATSGLILALRLACGDGQEPGEILTPPITCTATNWAILAAGHRIRWVDTSPLDGNLDVEDLRRKISPQTRAIMLVHWAGYPNDLDGVRSVQRECLERFGHYPPVIEDAAHALGATYQGRRLGSQGNYTVFSFQAIKHLTCGDGGALLCPDEETSRRGRLLRWYGLDRTQSDIFRCEQDVKEWGYKFHMNDINAVIGRANLPLLDETLGAHQANAKYYREELRQVPGITLLHEAPDRVSAAWLLTIRVANRDGLQAKLREQGVMCGRVHERNDRYTCSQPFHDGDLPGTDVMHREMLCVPVGWWLTPDDRQYIVDIIRQGW